MAGPDSNSLQADVSAGVRFLRGADHDLFRIAEILRGDAAALDQTAMNHLHDIATRMTNAAEAVGLCAVARAARRLAALAEGPHIQWYDFGLRTLQFKGLLIELREELFKARNEGVLCAELLLPW